jgi:hypothetical protein
MATFNGVFPAGELVPAPCGILSVANVQNHTARERDERWVRKFAYEYDSMPSYVRLLTVNDETIAAGELSDNQADANYQYYVPFYIDAEIFDSTFSLPGEDRFAQVVKALDCVTQKALEYEFWEGVAAQEETDALGNMYLRKSGAATIPVVGAKKPENALMLLEQAIASSPVGESGVIHMTRDVASILGSRLIYKKGETENSGRAMTRLGTDVIIGSGYTGNGPIGDANATASATNKWMYATSSVQVHLGKVEIVNENLGQGADVTINNMRIKAFRPAAAYADPSMLFAMRVTLPSD